VSKNVRVVQLALAFVHHVWMHMRTSLERQVDLVHCSHALDGLDSQ
jgi:hypothetical protein